MTRKPKREPLDLAELRRLQKNPKEPAAGASCPHCGCCESNVYRTIRKLNKTMRDRVCGNCGARFLTRETAVGTPDLDNA